MHVQQVRNTRLYICFILVVQPNPLERGSVMLSDQASDVDIKLMAKVLQEAHTDLANGGAGVAAMIASPDQIIAVAHNSIPETGDFNQPCGNGLAPSSRAAAARNVRAGPS
jgi:hypothetical protein